MTELLVLLVLEVLDVRLEVLVELKVELEVDNSARQ